MITLDELITQLVALKEQHGGEMKVMKYFPGIEPTHFVIRARKTTIDSEYLDEVSNYDEDEVTDPEDVILL